MIVNGIFVNGEQYEYSKMNSLSWSISDAWELTGGNCGVTVIDDDKLLFNAARTLTEGEIIVLEIYDENEDRIFVGDVDASQVAYDERAESTSLSASNLFNRIKGTIVQAETWARPGSTTYTVSEESSVNEGPTQFLMFEGQTDNLYTDDELNVVVPQQGTDTIEKLKVLWVEHQTGKVMLESKPSKIIPAATVCTRINNELRFLSVQSAFDRLNADLQAIGTLLSRPLGFIGGGSTGPGWDFVGSTGENIFSITIENETANITLDEFITAPYEVPQLPGELGSVYLMTGFGTDDVLARYITRSETATVKNLITFGFDIEPTLLNWTVADDTFVTVFDWLPHTVSEPPNYLPQHFNAASTEAYDIDNEYMYEIEGPGGSKFTYFVRWELVAGLWTNRTEISSPGGIGFIHGVTYDNDNGTLYCAADSKIYEVNVVTGVFSAVTGDLPGIGTISCLSLAGLLVMSSKTGGVVTIVDINDAFSDTTIETTYKAFVESIRVWNGTMYFLGANQDNTKLFAYDWNGTEWEEQFSDTLLNYQAEYGRILTRANHLFIEVNGNIWTHSKTVLPVLPRADVSGMSVGDITRNLAFFAFATIREDEEGIVWVTPKTAIPASSVTVTEVVSLKRVANWPDQYQRITVKGRTSNVVGSALTGVPGEDWEVSSAPFVFMSSHARAIALTLLNYHKYKRRTIRIASEQLEGLRPGDTFTFESTVYFIESLDIKPETQSITNNALSLPTIFATEVLAHEL